MPQYFKYNTGLTINNTTQKGNIAIASSGIYSWGPTSSTGFYVGIDAPSSGYTIYYMRSTGGPSVHVATGDTQAITFLKSFGATGTTINETLSWASGQSDYYVQTGTTLVTSGLTLHYDTSNASSYNGTGTTITDLSGNGRNGTITGSPTWTSNYFTFVDDYITTPNLSSVITSANEIHSVELWVYPTNNGVLVQYNNTITPNASYHFSSIEIVGGNLEVGLWNSAAISSTGNIGAVSFNQWHQIVLTYNGSVCKGYIDGVYKGSVNVSWSSPMDASQAFYMNFGYGTITNQGDGTNFDGRFGAMRVYNTALSDAQVLNNYNVDKSKYGL